MKHSSHIIAILIAVLVTIIILSLVGVLDFTLEDKDKEKNTTIIYPSRTVEVIPYYNRPRRVVHPRHHLRPMWRGRMGHHVRNRRRF